MPAHSNDIQVSPEVPAQERRRHIRHQFTAAVEAVDTVSQTRIHGRTSDLSRGGCYVDTISCFPLGSVVKMRLTKELRTFELEAQVVYSLNGMGMGLKFNGNNAEVIQTIETWMTSLRGAVPAESELVQSVEQQPAPVKSSHHDTQVLVELLTELMRQSVLPSTKCEAMLRKLKQPTPWKTAAGV